MGISPDQFGSTIITTGATSAIVDITTAAVGSWVYTWASLSNGGAVQVTDPSSAGWTKLTSANSGAAAGSTVAVYRRQKQQGDTTFTFSWTNNAKGTFSWVSYNGLNSVTPDEQATSVVNDVTSRSAVPTPSATPTGLNEWALAFFSQRSSNTAAKPTAWTADVALTERIEADNSAAASSPWMGSDIEDSNGAVTVAAHTYTSTSNQTQSHDGSAILFLIPAAPSSYTAPNTIPPRQPYPLSVIKSASTLVPQKPANLPNTFVNGLTSTDSVSSVLGAVATSPIKVSNLTAGTSTTGVTSIATASISPAGNSLVMLWVSGWDGGATNTTSVTSVSGLGLVWQQLTSVLPGGAKGTVGLWYAITGPNPGSGTVTINLATLTDVCWEISQATSVNLATPFVAGNVRTNVSNSTGPNVTMLAAQSVNNIFMFGASQLIQLAASSTMTGSETPVWNTLVTQEGNTADNHTNQIVQVSSNVSNLNAVATATVGHSWGAIGVELQAAPPVTFSSPLPPPFNQVFKNSDKSFLRAQIPQFVVLPAPPVTVTGLISAVNVVSNFGTLKITEAGNTANVNAAGLFGNLAIIGRTTALPTHGWPYFSKRYQVAPVKPNTFVSSATSSVATSANFGTIKELVSVPASSVNVAANFGGFVIVSVVRTTTQQFPFSANVPYPLNITRRIIPQYSYGLLGGIKISGTTANEMVATNFGTVTVKQVPVKKWKAHLIKPIKARVYVP